MRALALFALIPALCLAAEVRLGAPLSLDSATSIATLSASPEKYTGKVVQVKGKVTQVCQMMGCWMEIVEPQSKASIRLKVNDGEIVFPKDSIGKTATAEGTLNKISLSKEQAIARAKHEAEEQGRPFDAAKVKGPAVIYQIQARGAVLSE